MGAPKYLAITISGAVSLGSYEAGAMFQVLDAIRQHNEHVQQAGDGDPIYVDVITGASAGGMTASILARKLLLDGPSFKNDRDNPLYHTWVERIDLSELIGTKEKPLDAADDPATLSLLSSTLIAKIASETLQQAVDGKIPDNGAHAVIDPLRGIKLGLALTNLSGVDYGQQMVDNSDFQYTDFSDQMLRDLTPAPGPDKWSWRDKQATATWEELSAASVACGAFPVAFRAQDLDRSFDDYEADQPLTWTDGNRSFTYTDGGVLQNQPLGMAKNLVDDLDEHHNTDRRFYLFVSPDAMQSFEDRQTKAADTTILHILNRLISVLMRQAMFRDWVQAEQINHQVKMLDARASALRDELLKEPASTLDPAQLSIAARSILPLLYASAGGDEQMDNDFLRLQRQYAAEVTSLGGPADPRAHALLLTIQALEKGANLGERDLMYIHNIVVAPNTLAGEGVFAFVGFFSQDYREHDYDCGRQKALELLANINNPPAGDTRPRLGPIIFTPPQTIVVDPALKGLTLDKVDPTKVKLFEDGLIHRVNQILAGKIENPVERFSAEGLADVLLKVSLGRAFAGKP